MKEEHTPLPWTKANEDLVSLFQAVLEDYEHCCPDAEGNIDDWRKALIKAAKAAIAEATKN